MAIFDFTKFLNAVSNPKPISSYFPFHCHAKHENISLSNYSSEQYYIDIASVFLTLSKFYNFCLRDGDTFHYLGFCRVVSIVINDSSYPELLLENQEGKQFGFYHLKDLFSLDSTTDNLSFPSHNFVTPLQN